MSRNLTYDQWLPYTRYEKHECDIKLKDGTIVKHVYPNAGKFNKNCGSNQAIDESEVIEIMYRKYYFENNLCTGDCNYIEPTEEQKI